MSRENPYILLTPVHQWCGVVAALEEAEAQEFVAWLHEVELPAWQTWKYLEIGPDYNPHPIRYHKRGEVTGSLSFLTSHEGAVLIALRWPDRIQNQTIDEIRARKR